MPTYEAPGIYVEDVPGGARPIQAIGMSTPAFLGLVPRGDARVGEAVAITNWTQFVREYVPEHGIVTSTPLARAVRGFIENGGGRCYVVNLGAGGELEGDARRRTGLAALDDKDDVRLVAAPGFTEPGHWDALLAHAERHQDRFSILDPPLEVDAVERLTKVQGTDVTEKGGLGPRRSPKGFGAVYFPWLKVRDPFTGEVVAQAPSGHVMGIYGRSDAQRGVHKAPANEIVRGALGLTYPLTRDEVALLNPSGVNCIRFFSDSGTKVWGARTLADAASEYRYVNVRRIMIQIMESIRRGTSWIVFEPNAPELWKSIVRDISGFLYLLWRDGALLGTRPEQAYFVRCDSETNSRESIDAGQVVTVIGVAPVKPAEFVIFRVSQWAGGGVTDEVGGAASQGGS